MHDELRPPAGAVRSTLPHDVKEMPPMNLHEFMHTPAVTCSRDTGVADVARLMETNDVGSVVVLEADGQLAGIVTDRDLAIRVVGRRHEPDTPIREIMTPNVVFLREDTNLFAAATEMATAHCRRMPVIGADGRIRGVVSLDDLLTLFARQTDKLAEAVAEEMPRSTAE
jgi:signal-transduction protein with cAMP-binding, CBS, and nucleotidyltransferase domain